MSSERGWRRWRTPVGIGIAVVAIAVAAAFANVALLGSAGEDRLGRLRPVTQGEPAAVTAPAGGGTTEAEPLGTTTDRDDHGGSGSGGRGRDHDEDD